jgi:hypothetical protein
MSDGKRVARLNRGIAAAILATLFTASTAAEACSFWKDENGFYRGDCKLSADFKNKYFMDIELIATGPRFHLKMPDFHPRKFKYFLLGSSVDISLDVQNLGDLDNGIATDIAVMITFMDPLTSTQRGNTITATASLGALAVGATQRYFTTTVQLPNTTQDWDIVAVAVVDPPTAAQPVRGRVMELDEANNVLSHTCRIYGPNPDLTGPEVCN